MRKHASGTTFIVAMPSRLLHASLLEIGHKWHDWNTLGGGGRVERIHLGLSKHDFFHLLFARRRTKRNGLRNNCVVNRFAFGLGRLFFGLGGCNGKVDGLNL
jgi:hypothetical protein